jgi:hypothetical protein
MVYSGLVPMSPYTTPIAVSETGSTRLDPGVRDRLSLTGSWPLRTWS